MKKWIVGLALIAASNVSGFQTDTFAAKDFPFIKQADPRTFFITDDGQLTPNLIALLEIDHLYNQGDSFEEALKKTQSSLVLVNRGANQKERADLVDSSEWISIRPEVLQIVDRMGLLDERKPTLQHYDYAICHGAFLEGVRFRLAQIIELWRKGIRFDSLIFLTGERYLRKGPGEKDDYALLCDAARSPFPFKPGWIPPNRDQIAYETEYDMVKIVWEQAEIPDDMLSALLERVQFINTPRGNAQRPAMDTTYAYWLEHNHPQPGTILAASHPLIWSYQQITASNVLGPRFMHETVAPQAPYLISNRYEPGLTSLIFDTVAKCLFQINKSRQTNNPHPLE